MNHKENLFAAFPAISKKEWLEKVEKDLKGKALTELNWHLNDCLLYTSPSPRDRTRSRMPSSA